MRGITAEASEAAACAANTVQRMQGHGDGKQTQGRHFWKVKGVSQGCLQKRSEEAQQIQMSFFFFLAANALRQKKKKSIQIC